MHTPQGAKLLAWCAEREELRQFFLRSMQEPALQPGDFSDDRMSLLEAFWTDIPVGFDRPDADGAPGWHCARAFRPVAWREMAFTKWLSQAILPGSTVRLSRGALSHGYICVYLRYVSSSGF